jgi:hypothetical protein
MEKSAMSQGVVHTFSRRPTRTFAPEGSERTTRATIWASPPEDPERAPALRQAPRLARRRNNRDSAMNFLMDASLPNT